MFRTILINGQRPKRILPLPRTLAQLLTKQRWEGGYTSIVGWINTKALFWTGLALFYSQDLDTGEVNGFGLDLKSRFGV